jgi:ATP-dependent helicase HrpB
MAGAGTRPDSARSRDEAFLNALLVAYPDRVARVRGEVGERRSLIVVGGQTASLAEASALGPARWALALALQQHKAGARSSQAIVRSAARIETDWLIDLFTDEIEERVEVEFDSERERVEGHSLLLYRGLTIERSKVRGGDAGRSLAVATALREAALARGAEHFVKPEGSLPCWLARVALCHEYDSEFPRVDAEAVESCLSELCDDKASFAELRQADLMAHLQGLLGARARDLDLLCPSVISIPGRRRLAIEYEAGKPPYCSSRLQDFFGISEAPKVLRGSTPLVLHLLAPNRRAVQVTTDLAGFWERHYPALRKSLMRRYPRHAWPEDPTVIPPKREPRKR